MKQRQFYIILLLLGILMSCKKKDYPASDENSVVYYFKGDVDGKPLTIEAGNNDYYMFTSVSAYSPSTSVNNFKGDLRKINCANCAPAVQIAINDYKITANGSKSNIDSSLRVGNYPIIKSGTMQPHKVFFKSTYNRIAVSYLWDFGDGTATSGEKDPAHVYKESGNYNVCLTIKELNGCTSTICSEQKVGQPNRSKATILAAFTDSASVDFSQSSSGSGSLRYVWDFGDGSTTTVADPPPHTYAVKGSYPVTLKVTDSNNDVVIAHYNVVTLNDQSSCSANYQVLGEIIATDSPEFLNLSGISVTWTDASGLIYTSNNLLQPTGSFFEVLSVEESDTNERGQRTKKMHIRFKATLYNGNKTMTVENVDAVIGVAYN